jgi:hypothetical protein
MDGTASSTSWTAVTMGRKRQNRRLASARARPVVAQPAHNPKDAAMSDQRLAAEREARLDEILTALWKRKLPREVAAGRLKAELGLSYRDALAKVDGFLQD